MDREIARLQQNIARIRRDIRLQSREMQALIDADIDCTDAARLLMRMWSPDLRQHHPATDDLA
jgi:hypothetical protein